jgi:hypothetical protein
MELVVGGERLLPVTVVQGGGEARVGRPHRVELIARQERHRPPYGQLVHGGGH